MSLRVRHGGVFMYQEVLHVTYWEVESKQILKVHQSVLKDF